MWIGVEIAIVYFLFVETAGYTLEELSDIFHARNPRNASIGGVVGAATGARKERKGEWTGQDLQMMRGLTGWGVPFKTETDADLPAYLTVSYGSFD